VRRAAALALALAACGGGGGDDPDATPSACLGVPVEVPLEPWTHFDVGSALPFEHEPPASGPHYPAWARYGVHDAALARGYWVHNLEHGAIVLLHREGAPAAVVDELRAAYEDLPEDPACGHRRSLVAPDAALTTEVAVIAAGWFLEGDCVDAPAIVAFARSHRGEGPEDVCTDGTIP
jgi:hypothetical protein